MITMKLIKTATTIKIIIKLIKKQLKNQLYRNIKNNKTDRYTIQVREKPNLKNLHHKY